MIHGFKENQPARFCFVSCYTTFKSKIHLLGSEFITISTPTTYTTPSRLSFDYNKSNICVINELNSPSGISCWLTSYIFSLINGTLNRLLHNVH